MKSINLIYENMHNKYFIYDFNKTIQQIMINTFHFKYDIFDVYAMKDYTDEDDTTA